MEFLTVLMRELLTLVTLVKRKGLFSLESAVENMKEDIPLRGKIAQSMNYLIEGFFPEDMEEMMTASYWIAEKKGYEGLYEYFIIITALRMKEGQTKAVLEQMFLSCLSEQAQEQYKHCCANRD